MTEPSAIHARRGWLGDHAFDLLMVLLTLVGLWIAYEIPKSLNDQDSAERLKAERTARFESDLGQINQLVAGALGEDGQEHVVAKRAAARAISDYSQQGRVYAPATSILFHYLERENDPRTHCYLHAAIDRGLNTKPPALGVGARSVDGTSLNEESWGTTITVERARLQSLLMVTDTADCATASTPEAVAPALQGRASVYRQYLDVDCQRVNSNGNLRVPIDSTLAAQFKIASASAQIQDASNLKEATASVVRSETDSAIIQYSIVGLDRQLFGNCPGGGHGTLVVQFQLVPK
jgi:hypothetical protein